MSNVPRPVVALAASAVLLAGCAAETGDDDSRVALGHIHGLGVNTADGALYAASHHGLFQVSGSGEPAQIAGWTQDFMGFTIVGPNHFLASGHPAPDDDTQPPNLGLIESTDGGQTWTSVSLSGEVDFHAMEAKHGKVYGYDSQSGQLMSSTDQHNWDGGARMGIADIAVAPDQPDEIIATTGQGLARSTDGGRTFTTLPSAPPLVLVDWPETRRLIGAAPDGAIYASADRGVTWTRRGQVGGSPHAITTVGNTEIYLATEDTIQHSRDEGVTFEVFEQF